MAHAVRDFDVQPFLRIGDEILCKTRDLVLRLWQSPELKVQIKSDQTPVTEIDTRCEEMAREILRRRLPEHDVLGEEYHTTPSGSDFVWTIDPIDGTENLVNGIPTFGTFLGLQYRNIPLLGFVDYPALDVRIAGGPGVGITRNGLNLAPGALATTTSPLITCGPIHSFAWAGASSLFHALCESYPKMRVYYDCFSLGLLLTGAVRAGIEVGLEPWELVPIRALVEEAGGQLIVLRDRSAQGFGTDAVFGHGPTVEHMARLATSLLQASSPVGQEVAP